MKPNYREREVRAIVERYEELQYQKGTEGYQLRNLLTLVDIQRALQYARLSAIERQAVYLHGIANMTTREAGEVMRRNKDIVRKHYLRGIEKLTSYLNGGRF